MIGLIGTGLMGAPMAERLLINQVALIVYNRSLEKAEPLRQAGAEIAGSVPELLQQSEVVILMLSDQVAIRAMLLSDEAKSSLAGRTIIQMSTIAASQSRSLAKEILALGGSYFEAPVLGSIPEAQAGKLQVMVGATPEQFQQWQPLLQQLGTPILVGEVGTAAALKLALNQLIAALTTAFALSLGLVERQGVEVDTFMQILRQSALYAPTFDKKLQRMEERNFENPNFPTKHLLKDVKLFLSEAETSELQTDSLVGVRQILEIACSLGLADADYSALFAAISPDQKAPSE